MDFLWNGPWLPLICPIKLWIIRHSNRFHRAPCVWILSLKEEFYHRLLFKTFITNTEMGLLEATDCWHNRNWHIWLSSNISVKHETQCFITNRRELHWKYDAQRSIFDGLRGVSSGDETLCQMLDITSQTKWFQKKKLRMQKWAVFHLISKHSLNINFLSIFFMNYCWVWELKLQTRTHYSVKPFHNNSLLSLKYVI